MPLLPFLTNGNEVVRPDFPQFPKLPPELQDKIWSSALSDNIQALLISGAEEQNPRNYPGLVSRACHASWAQAARQSIFHVPCRCRGRRPTMMMMMMKKATRTAGTTETTTTTTTVPDLCRLIRYLLVDGFCAIPWHDMPSLRHLYVVRNRSAFQVVTRSWRDRAERRVLGSGLETRPMPHDQQRRQQRQRQERQHLVDLSRGAGDDEVELEEHASSAEERRDRDRIGPIMMRWRGEDGEGVRGMLGIGPSPAGRRGGSRGGGYDGRGADSSSEGVAGNNTSATSYVATVVAGAGEATRVLEVVPVVWAVHDRSSHCADWLARSAMCVAASLSLVLVACGIAWCAFWKWRASF